MSQQLYSPMRTSTIYTTNMLGDMVDDLQKIIESIKMRLASDKLSSHEIRTRYALIDPLLTALGWDVSNPELVIPEYASGDGSKAGRPDYKMGNTMVVEAKRRDIQLGDEFEKKVLMYMEKHRVWYGVLTNGKVWQIYRTQKNLIPGLEKTIIEFDLRENCDAIVRKAERLCEHVIRCDHRPPQARHSSTDSGKRRWHLRVRGTMPREWKEPNPEHKIALNQVARNHALDLLNKLEAPDNYVISLESEKDIPVFVADWLVQKDILSERHCPIKAEDGNVIFDKEKLRRNDRRYDKAEPVGRFYVDADPQKAAQSACKLIEDSGGEPSEFYLIKRL